MSCRGSRRWSPAAAAIAWGAAALLGVAPRAAAPAAPSRAAAPAPHPAAAPAAGNPFHLKPGAQGKVCQQCHSDMQETLKLPFVHKPVQTGDCVRCHSPHASDHGKMLAAAPGELCARCHVVKAASRLARDRSVHPPAAAGDCVKCHDPHAGRFKGQLRVAGNELCFGCHGEIAKTVAAAKFQHPPAAKSCLGCHDPHSSPTAPHLLKKAVPGLCLDCHRADQAAFSNAHMGYPVAKADCTSCHNPHGSDRGGILWAVVHPPVANRMCGQCHAGPGTPNPLALKRAGIDLCRTCHGDLVSQALAKNRVHWPLVDAVGCLNCHNPHASIQPSLLKMPARSLCAGCHAATVERLDRAAVKHPPAAEGECVTCHSPHASDAPFLFTEKDEIGLCSTCHDWKKHSNHPIGEKAVDPRNRNLTLDCSSCHEAHGSPYRAFAHLDPNGQLCVQCHQEMRR